MNVRRAARRRALVLAAAALASVSLLTACSGDGDPAAGEPPVQMSGSASVPIATPLTAAQVDAFVGVTAREIRRASRQLEKCETRVAGYGFNSCWPRALPATDAAGQLATTLSTSQVPPEYAALQDRVVKLAAAGDVLRKGCRKGDDQKCDLALMRFRNDVQKVEWEIDLV